MSVFNTVIAQENGKELKAYVATPKGGKGPGLILMHEVYGVTGGLKEVADKFAEAGFVVACPNMYWRADDNASFKYDPPAEVLAAMPEKKREALKTELARDRDCARDLMFNIVGNPDPAKGPVVTNKNHLAQMQNDVLDTINKVSAYLRNHEKGNGRCAVSGFCFGGRNTYLAMAHGADVDAGVAFYATPKLHEVFNMQDAQAINKPLMFVVGGEDPYISDDEKEDMIIGSSGTIITYVAGRKIPLTEPNEAGNPDIATLYYANSNHGFNRRESKYSDPGTSDHALGNAIEFLRAALGSKGAALDFRKTPNSPTYHPVYKV